jgi:ethanolamine utilization microcompartment shell protein EutL
MNICVHRRPVDPTRPDAEVPDPANPGKMIKAPMQVDVTQMDALLDSLVQVRAFSPARRTSHILLFVELVTLRSPPGETSYTTLGRTPDPRNAPRCSGAGHRSERVHALRAQPQERCRTVRIPAGFLRR